MAVRERIEPEQSQIVDMAWDPITRIVGNLGIYTKIDFKQREVGSHKSRPPLSRGSRVLKRERPPPPPPFPPSPICGIWGDTPPVCSMYAQNMAYGVKPPPL